MLRVILPKVVFRYGDADNLIHARNLAYVAKDFESERILLSGRYRVVGFFEIVKRQA